MWKHPWGYKEGFTISAGLVLTGILLQLTTGAVNTDFFTVSGKCVFRRFVYNIHCCFIFHIKQKHLNTLVIRYDCQYNIHIGIFVSGTDNGAYTPIGRA